MLIKLLGNITHTGMFKKKLIFSLKARRGLQRPNCSWQNSAQSWTLRSITLCGVTSTVNFNCWLCAVLYCTESDSAQYHTAWSRTWSSITLGGVTFFANMLSETIWDCLSGTQIGSIHVEIKLQKFHDTASLRDKKKFRNC